MYDTQLRRFITLIDALYEHKVLVVVLADAPIMELFSPEGVKPTLSSAEPETVDGKNTSNGAQEAGSASPGSDNDQVSQTAEARLQFDEVGWMESGLLVGDLSIDRRRLLTVASL